MPFSHPVPQFHFDVSKLRLLIATSSPLFASFQEERTILMFSATFPQEIQKLAQRFLRNHLFLSVGIVGGACEDVTQRFFEVSKFEKKDKLKEILTEEGNNICYWSN